MEGQHYLMRWLFQIFLKKQCFLLNNLCSAYIVIFGAYVFICSAEIILMRCLCHFICGAYTSVFGAFFIIFGANYSTAQR